MSPTSLPPSPPSGAVSLSSTLTAASSRRATKPMLRIKCDLMAQRDRLGGIALAILLWVLSIYFRSGGASATSHISIPVFFCVIALPPMVATILSLTSVISANELTAVLCCSFLAHRVLGILMALTVPLEQIVQQVQTNCTASPMLEMSVLCFIAGAALSRSVQPSRDAVSKSAIEAERGLSKLPASGGSHCGNS